MGYSWSDFKKGARWFGGKVSDAANSVVDFTLNPFGITDKAVDYAGELFGAINGSTATNETNKAIAQDTNATNERIAQENLAYQRDNLEYLKALQQQIFDREDTSYQRTVNDMRGVGMSPLSMQGTNGAGEAIATDPLNNTFQKQGYQVTPNDILGSVMSLASVASTLNGLQLQGQQTRKLALENDVASALKDIQIDTGRLNYNRANRDFSFQKLYGITDSQTSDMKNVFALGSVLGMPLSTSSGDFKRISSKDFEDYLKKVASKLKDMPSADISSIVADPTSSVVDVGKKAVDSMGKKLVEKLDKSPLAEGVRKLGNAVQEWDSHFPWTDEYKRKHNKK